MREEDRQHSVAIEFVTNADRLDSENRQQVVNNLVQQMNAMSRTRVEAVSRYDGELEDGQGQDPGQRLPTFQNNPVIPRLGILREEDEEEKEVNTSGRFPHQRNPFSELNSHRNEYENNADNFRNQDFDQHNPYNINSSRVQGTSNLIQHHPSHEQRFSDPSLNGPNSLNY